MAARTSPPAGSRADEDSEITIYVSQGGPLDVGGPGNGDQNHNGNGNGDTRRGRRGGGFWWPPLGG
jgi:hypothetical protein